ncbi:MAG: GGDEF domain-containing protein, partial [Oscillospiraceae bacterium]|nr:GGDEF domain-containing protein [Oscillospiraceae bacterium]
AKSRTYSEIAESLASLFEVIYYIDVNTDNYAEYSASESYAQLGFGQSGENFFQRAKTDIQAVIHPDDRSKVMHQLEKDVLLAGLKKSASVSVTYRQVLDGRTQYMNLLAFRLKNNEERIVVGVRNIDEQKKQESAIETYSHIAGALASRYEVIYYINIDTNHYTQYSASEQYAKLGTTKEGITFFEDCIEDIQKYIHPEDRNRLFIHLDKHNLMANLKQSGSISLSYRQLLDDRYQYMNMTIVQPKNDLHHIIVGVFNMDAQIRHERSIKATSKTFNDIATALAQRYEVIYHVNVLTNEYAEYSASDKYTRLKVGAKGNDFFTETQENMKRDIYPEDFPMMSVAMQKENLLNSLSNFGKTILNYRLMIDGTPQYVSLYAVRPKEDSEHIIIAVANVDAAKRMEIAYQNAIDIANRDALTGVKNKRAYVQFEIELDEQIKEKENLAFAIVICDVNGLKQVNDTKGHTAGDEFIRSACKVICNTFKHSPVFRIGGDEFAVILKGQDYLSRTELMLEMTKYLNENSRDGLILLASGISDFHPEQDIHVQDVFERADMHMYLNKKQCKAAASQKGGLSYAETNE